MLLRKLLTNWPYKLVSLGAAIVLTSYVHGERNPTISSTVMAAVRCEHLGEGYVAAPAERSIPVTLKGPKSQVEAVVDSAKSASVTAVVDLSGCAAGAHSVRVGKVLFPEPLPEGVSAQPAVTRVAVTVEALASKTMPVGVKIASSLPIGWASGAAAIDPASVTVSGASSLVDEVDRLIVTVEPTPTKPAVDEYCAIRALDARGEDVKGVRIAPDVAHIALKLVQAPADKSVFVSPSIIGQPQYPYRVAKVTVNPGSVTIKGKPADLVNVGTIATDDVDIGGAVADVVRSVSLRVPPGTEVEGPRSATVTVRIQVGPTD